MDRAVWIDPIDDERIIESPVMLMLSRTPFGRLLTISKNRTKKTDKLTQDKTLLYVYDNI